MSELEIDVAAGTMRVRINRPSTLNAISTSVKRGLIDALDEAERRTDVSCFLLTGTGRAFCSGADINELDQVAAAETLQASLDRVMTTQRLVERCRRSTRAVVVAVNGIAAGGGVSLALAGDVIIASESASFNLLFGRRGLIPDGALSRTLVEAVGRRRALALSLTCSDIAAARALEIGLVDEVVPDGDLLDRAESICAEMHERGITTIALTKQVFTPGSNADLSIEALAQATLLTRESPGQSETKGLT